MTEHDRQHRIVAEAKAKYDAAPGHARKHGVKYVAGQKAWWALTWHMRRSHREALRARSPFLGLTYAELEAWHTRLHEETT